MDHAEAGKQFLAHYGVKGMRWGKTSTGKPTLTKAPAEKKAVEVTTKQNFRGKQKLKTKGGEGHEPHPDAVKVATAHQKLKKSGAHTLSNKELQDVATRMNLEQQVSRLSTQNSPGKKFVKEFVGQQGKQELNRQAQESLKKKKR